MRGMDVGDSRYAADVKVSALAVRDGVQGVEAAGCEVFLLARLTSMHAASSREMDIFRIGLVCVKGRLAWVDVSRLGAIISAAMMLRLSGTTPVLRNAALMFSGERC